MANGNDVDLVLDPGHGGTQNVGGSDANHATGPNGLLEKSLTLDIAQRVQQLLSGQLSVLMTRTTDTNLSLSDRAQVARGRNAALFLSIHFNGWHDPSVDGTEVWIANNPNQASRDFAQEVLTRVVAVTGVRNRGVKQQDFGVLLPARHAARTGACLVEIAFLTNPQQADNLSRGDYKDRIAQAIAEAVRARLATPAPAPTRRSLITAPTTQDWGEPLAAQAIEPYGVALDRPSDYPMQVRQFWAAPAARLHHTYWHQARMWWPEMNAAQQADIRAAGFSPPPRLAANSQQGRNAAAGAGIDFLAMHRQMIEATRGVCVANRLTYRPIGWNPIPWSHTDADWPMPVVPAFARESFKSQATTDYWRSMVTNRYWNAAWLATKSLDELGAELEEGVHGWMHMHWSGPEPSNPRDTSTSNDFLGSFFSSAVNPTFWKLHGFIDDVIGRWERAPVEARTGAARSAAAEFARVTPWLGPVPAAPAAAAPTPARRPGGSSLPFSDESEYSDLMEEAMAAANPAGGRPDHSHHHHLALNPQQIQQHIARLDFSRPDFPAARLPLVALRERFGREDSNVRVAGLDEVSALASLDYDGYAVTGAEALSGGGSALDRAVDDILTYIQRQARANAGRARTVSGSNFSRILDSRYLSSYLAAPNAGNASAAIAAISRQNTSGAVTTVCGSPDFWEASTPTFNGGAIPSAVRRIPGFGWLPASFGAATEVLTVANRRTLSHIDVPYLLGRRTIDLLDCSTIAVRSRDPDLQANNSINESQLMHWATGVKYASMGRDRLRELFIAYELWHLELWDVFGADPINDLIAEDAARHMAEQITSLRMNRSNYIAVLDEGFEQARAWVGALLRLRRSTLDRQIKADPPPSAWIHWSQEVPPTSADHPFRAPSIRAMLASGTPAATVQTSPTVARYIEVYTLLFEADAWEAAHGSVATTWVQRNVADGTLNSVFRAASAVESRSSALMGGAMSVTLWNLMAGAEAEEALCRVEERELVGV